MDKKLITNFYPTTRVSMSSIYRMSDAPPNWAQDDPTQPDYIKNKEEAEKLRPIYVNGEQILDDARDSGPLNLVAGNNVRFVLGSENGDAVDLIISTDIDDATADKSGLVKLGANGGAATYERAEGIAATANSAVQNVTALAKADGTPSGVVVTRTGNNIALAIDDTITWAFDCGGADI